MTTVLLIRHGESESNIGLPMTKPTECIPLTELGHRQSRLVATAVPVPDLIVTSPYVRAKQTAQPTMQRYPNCPQVEWQVQEFDYVTISTKICDRAEVLQLCKAYWQRRDPFYRDGEAAESFAHLMQRVATLLHQIQQFNGQTLLVFSHSGFIRAVLWAVLMQPSEITPKAMDKFCNFIQAIRVPNGAMIKLQVEPDHMFVSPVLSNHLQEG